MIVEVINSCLRTGNSELTSFSSMSNTGIGTTYTELFDAVLRGVPASEVAGVTDDSFGSGNFN